MSASRASLLCLLLAACSSDNGGATAGAGGYGGAAAGASGVPVQPVGAAGGVPGGVGMATLGNGGSMPLPGSGGSTPFGNGGTVPGGGGTAQGVGGLVPGGGGMVPGGGGTVPGGGASNGGAGGGSGDPAKGCDSTTLLAGPANPSAHGPWPVGDKTVTVSRVGGVSFKVEVMYPATVGSDAGKQAIQWDLRDWLPASERSKVKDADAKSVSAGTFADLPFDTTHGPYPVIVLVHGTGAFRIASATSQATWASHGFVVLAADHPNLCLTDYLAFGCGMTGPALDLSADVDAELAAITAATGDFAFLAGHVDTKRVGLAGHSAGAWNVAQFSAKPGVQVIVPLSGTHAVAASSSLKSVAFIGGMADTVLGYSAATGIGQALYPGSQTGAYTGSPGAPVKKRLMGITGGGHLAVTDLCQVNNAGKNPIQVSQAAGVCGIGLLPSLFDCGTVDRVTGITAVDDLSTAVFEETLQCQDMAATISAIKTRNTVIGDFQESK